MEVALDIGTRLPPAPVARRCRSWPYSSRPTRICLRGVADGDRDAFGDLYQRYARPVPASRYAGSATAAGRGRGPGGVRLRLARGPHVQARPWPGRAVASTRSRATRSPTAAAPASSRRPSWSTPHPNEPGPMRRPSSPGSPGASIARSRPCPTPSGRCSSSRTGAVSRKAKFAAELGIPPGHREDPTRSGLAGSQTSSKGSWDEHASRFPRPGRRRGHAGGAGEAPARTRRCWSPPAQPPELSPRIADAAEDVRARRAVGNAGFPGPPSGSPRPSPQHVRRRLTSSETTALPSSSEAARSRCTASAGLRRAHASLAVGDHEKRYAGNYPLKMTVCEGCRSHRVAAGTSLLLSKRAGQRSRAARSRLPDGW